MAWYDTHQAAVDPDNPAANEQITFDEWNAMVSYLKDKIIDKAVNAAAIGNDKVLVYKTASSTFVFEAQTGGAAAINDLTDVTISGVPADNEVLAYDTGTSEWINQTAAEAGLATVAGLASYLPLSAGVGEPLTGHLYMGGNYIYDVLRTYAYNTAGIGVFNSVGASRISFAPTNYAFTAYADADMNGQNLINVLDPTSAQHASTKNYDDTHLFTKEAVTSFTDGYIPVYRTSSGKFEMEEAGGSAGLPVVDTTSIVKGSADGTKLMRFEVDGLTTGTTRVMTIPDKNITLCDIAEVMLLSGVQPMTSDLDMGDQNIVSVNSIRGYSDSAYTVFRGGVNTYSSAIYLYGKDHATLAGHFKFLAPDAAGTNLLTAMEIHGKSDAPLVEIGYGLDINGDAAMNGNDIDDIGALILNDATELTIAAGTVTATQSYHTIDTQSDDATDDLGAIGGGTAGQKLTLRAEDGARTVVIKNNTTPPANIALEGDMTLDNVHDTLSLIYDGTNWLETGRSNNGA